MTPTDTSATRPTLDTTATRPTLADTSDGIDHAADIEAIRAVIADVELGYNTKDPVPAVEHFAADAIAISAPGAVVAGWDAIEAAHRAAYAGFLKDGLVRYEIDQITFVRPDVAIVLKSARAVASDGQLLDIDHAMRALYTLVREGGRWWIAARGNTLVAR